MQIFTTDLINLSLKQWIRLNYDYCYLIIYWNTNIKIKYVYSTKGRALISRYVQVHKLFIFRIFYISEAIYKRFPAWTTNPSNVSCFCAKNKHTLLAEAVNKLRYPEK